MDLPEAAGDLEKEKLGVARGVASGVARLLPRGEPRGEPRRDVATDVLAPNNPPTVGMLNVANGVPARDSVRDSVAS